MPRRGWHPGPRAIIGDPTDPRGMAALRDQYLDHMAVLNFAPDTIYVRRVYLNFFVKWCHERSVVRPGEVTKPIVDRYQRWMYQFRSPKGKPLSFTSQNGRLAAVKAWFRWLTRFNHILSNPASDVDLPRVDRKLPRHVLTASEVDQILNGTEIKDLRGLRDRAFLETLYSTGLRRREMVNLSIYDVDMERGTVLVRKGKNRKDRIVPIGQRAILWLSKYLSEARPQLAPNREEALFVTQIGDPFTANSATQLARHYVEKAKLPSGKRGACHLFRHTMATLMLEGGADVRYVQAMLGHADISSTQIYTHVGIRTLQQVHAITHPAGLVKRPSSIGVAGHVLPAYGANEGSDLPDVLVEDPACRRGLREDQPLPRPGRAPPVNGNAADLADFLARDDDDDTLDELGAGDTGDAAGGAEVAAFGRADDG
jgi:integrase/recombinase XerD